MTIDESINILEDGDWWEELGEWYIDVNTEYDRLHEAVDMAIEALKEKNAGWISVDDRLPEEKVNCIVHYQHAYCNNDDYWAIGFCFYDGEKFQFNPAYKVTHWMPQPQPPKGE